MVGFEMGDDDVCHIRIGGSILECFIASRPPAEEPNATIGNDISDEMFLSPAPVFSSSLLSFFLFAIPMPPATNFTRLCVTISVRTTYRL